MSAHDDPPEAPKKEKKSTKQNKQKAAQNSKTDLHPLPPKEDQISKSTLEIHQQSPPTVYTSMQDLSDDLPDNAPRFVLLSYPLTLASGRLSVPYVMLNYLPATCNQETRMLYAGAKELMRNQSEAGRIIEIGDAEEVETIEEKLQGED